MTIRNISIFTIRDKLKEENLRLVSISDWKFESDKDSEGRNKCIELNGFPGVFRDFQGKCYDLRSRDLCPSYSNFMQKVTYIFIKFYIGN